jgi:hypothetical protein
MDELFLAKDAGLSETVGGLEHPQLGRAIAVRSAQPYPPLTAGRKIEAIAKMAPSTAGACAPARKPLTGYVVLDLPIIAGPACGRLPGELWRDRPKDGHHTA